MSCSQSVTSKVSSSDILNRTSFRKTAEFLDGIKELGFGWAFKAGLSFNLGDLIIPDLKRKALGGCPNGSG
jgi:DNA-directed RNA polymerase subunit beta'